MAKNKEIVNVGMRTATSPSISTLSHFSLSQAFVLFISMAISTNKYVSHPSFKLGHQ
jgi:hypothetical protein